MAVGRAERRAARRSRVVADFGPALADVVLDVIELVELAWHDCYGDVAPPDDVVDDILVCGAGDLAALVSAGRLAVTDWRDVRVQADRLRSSR